MMKKLEKLFVSVLIFGSLFLLYGCGKKNVEGSLEDIMAKVYKDIPEERKPMALTNMEVTDENIEGFIGTKDIEYEQALASESMTGSIAHSVVLIRTKDSADVDKIKTTIKENVDPRKWICVGIPDDEVIIKSKGNLIVVIIVEDTENRASLEKGFDQL